MAVVAGVRVVRRAVVLAGAGLGLLGLGGSRGTLRTAGTNRTNSGHTDTTHVSVTV